MNPTEPWAQPAWVARTRLLLDSYRRWLGRELLPRAGTGEEQSRALFDAPFVVVAHGTEPDPVLNYGNRTALALWETDLEHAATNPVPPDGRAGPPGRARPAPGADRPGRVHRRLPGHPRQPHRPAVPHRAGGGVERGRRRGRTRVGQAATFGEWTYLDG